jgi:hypothetical protein
MRFAALALAASLPPELQDQLRAEKRERRKAASAFARLCQEGDAERLYDCAQWLDETVDGWRLAMAKVGRLPRVSAEVQDVFVSVWIERKHIPLRVGHRPTMAAALRVLMPRNYAGPPLVLYRGCGSHERQRRLYGFSWTTNSKIARGFVPQDHAQLGIHGVLLKAIAPADAVLLHRDTYGGADYYAEGEVVVDPYRLGKVEIARLLDQ